MEPIAFPAHGGDELVASASWALDGPGMLETVTVWPSDRGGHQAAGGMFHAPHGNGGSGSGSVRMWELRLRTDWTAERLRVLWQDGESIREADYRHDGDRRWFDGTLELPPETRDTRFVAADEGVFFHTPILRHIGLDADEQRTIEVLELNVWNGHVAPAEYTYSPQGGGRWSRAAHGTETQIHVDLRGLVTEAGRARRL